MQLDFDLNLEQKQELVLTPKLQMAIEILQYSNLELKDYIEEEMKENPLLDMLEAEKEMDYKQSNFNVVEKERIQYENFVAYRPDFCEYLENQLFEVLSDEQIKLGKFIVGSLNQSGYLTLEPEKIAEIFSSSENEVLEVYEKIKELDIKTADDLKNCSTEYIDPDLIVKEKDGSFEVISNDKTYPTLRISSYYYNLLKNQNDEEISDYLKRKYQSALWLIKSIEQRKETIRKIVETIVEKQREFFENGLKHLYVMTMEEVAEAIDMHESTVSRATTSKYLQTPHGIFSLKLFFNSGINNISSVSIKAIISEEIAEEDKSSPLSDSSLAQILFTEYSLDISRRTVAKYRKSLGIPCSRKRKNNYNK